MHSMQIGRRTMYVHTHSVHTNIHINICKYIYRHLHTDVIVPEYSIISFPSATSFQLLCGSPASLSGNVYERFCATVRTHFECTCEFALVHPTQTATPAELTTHTQAHTNTHLKKSTKIKRKQTLKGGKCEGKRWWHRHNNAHNCRHASLLRGRGRVAYVCVCVYVPAREAANTKSTEANACIGIFIQAASHSVQTHIDMHSCVCVRERESEGALSLPLCVRCALHLTLALIPFSTLWAGVGFLTRFLTHLRWRHSLALSPPRSRILFDVRSREVGFVVSLTAVGI